MSRLRKIRLGQPEALPERIITHEQGAKVFLLGAFAERGGVPTFLTRGDDLEIRFLDRFLELILRAIERGT